MVRTLNCWFRLICTLLAIGLPLSHLQAWPAHPLIAAAALKNHPHWNHAAPVPAKTLEQFVVDNKEALAAFLAAHEAWSIQHLPHYQPAPTALAFQSSVSDEDALKQFLAALRVNPNIKVPLYLHIPPGSSSSLPQTRPGVITTLKNTNGMNTGTYVLIAAGMEVDPFMVLNSANDEPDYGFDLGLFEDNNTEYGAAYGFGKQTFGNPNLEYSSQAPFHMGFYHEPGIVFRFAPFLRKTFLDYRHNQYRALSAFAFQHNEPYWGYRFLGWSMHYLADATMPYHVRPLPGYSTLRMLWINLKAMLGFKEARQKAIQLVSNKHTAVEEYLQHRLVDIYSSGNFNDPLYQALMANPAIESVGHDYLVVSASKEAFKDSRDFDQAVRKGLPYDMVNDPTVETSNHGRLTDIIAYTSEVIKAEQIEQLEKICI